MWPVHNRPIHIPLSIGRDGGLTVGCNDEPNAVVWCASPGSETAAPSQCDVVELDGGGGCPGYTAGMAELGDGRVGMACGDGAFRVCICVTAAPTMPPTVSPAVATCAHGARYVQAASGACDDDVNNAAWMLKNPGCTDGASPLFPWMHRQGVGFAMRMDACRTIHTANTWMRFGGEQFVFVRFGLNPSGHLVLFGVWCSSQA